MVIRPRAESIVFYSRCGVYYLLQVLYLCCLHLSVVIFLSQLHFAPPLDWDPTSGNALDRRKENSRSVPPQYTGHRE